MWSLIGHPGANVSSELGGRVGGSADVTRMGLVEGKEAVRNIIQRGHWSPEESCHVSLMSLGVVHGPHHVYKTRLYIFSFTNVPSRLWLG
jgi:hypothetical protein